MNRPGKAFASARKRRIEWIFWKDFVGLEMSAKCQAAQTSRTTAAGPSLKSTARSDRHPCSACQLKSLPTISRGEDCWSHARAQRKGRVFTFPAFHPGALACDRCQSAGADKVRFRYGAGRAVAHRYPGIDVPRAPCPVRMDREDHRIHSVPKSTKFRGPRNRFFPNPAGPSRHQRSLHLFPAPVLTKLHTTTPVASPDVARTAPLLVCPVQDTTSGSADEGPLTAVRYSGFADVCLRCLWSPVPSAGTVHFLSVLLFNPATLDATA